MSQYEDMLQEALALLKLGYVPLRLDPDSKAARHNGWQNETPTEDSVRRSFSRLSNLGIRCGDLDKNNTCLLGLDIDLENAVLIGAVERALGDDLSRIPVKKGKKGATYIFRFDREQKTTKIKWVRDGNKPIECIDILCRNAQTVIPPSIHPDTKLPYRWIAGPPLNEVDFRTLPVYGPALLDEITGFCKNADDPIYALNDMIWAGVGGGGNTHDVCVRAVSSMVGRKWTDADIQARVQRAKREACEAAGMPYNWPEAQKVIDEWIKSSRDKNFDTTSKHGRKKDEDVPMEMINNYVYVQGLDRIHSRSSRMLMTKPVFDNIHSRDLKMPWISCLMHPDFQIVHRMTYSPGQPEICKEASEDNGAVHTCLNLYHPADISPEEGDASPWVNLVRHVFDQDEDAIKHVISFFAYMVQNPGQRINHGLVIQGEQGIGKDTILIALAGVIGKHNYSQVTLNQVESDFNSWLFGKQLIVFQEMMAAGRRGIYNKLKTYITEPSVGINEKHLAMQRLPNRAVYVFLTNYKHSMSIDKDDRRTWVWHSQAKALSPAFFDQFYDWIAKDQNIAALSYYLHHYDTSDFKPRANPPMTDAKRELVENSAPEVEQLLRMSADAKSWPMGCDIINLQHLYAALRPFTRVSLSILQETCESLGFRRLETRPRMGGTRLALWSVRNHEKMLALNGQKLAQAYRVPLPPQQGETEGSYSVYTGSDISEDETQEQF